jgi:hypothetical protein
LCKQVVVLLPMEERSNGPQRLLALPEHLAVEDVMLTCVLNPLAWHSRPHGVPPCGWSGRCGARGLGGAGSRSCAAPTRAP